jgi:hypothetical protein
LRVPLAKGLGFTAEDERDPSVDVVMRLVRERVDGLRLDRFQLFCPKRCPLPITLQSERACRISPVNRLKKEAAVELALKKILDIPANGTEIHVRCCFEVLACRFDPECYRHSMPSEIVFDSVLEGLNVEYDYGATRVSLVMVAAVRPEEGANSTAYF